MSTVNQNTAATAGGDLPETGKSFPEAPNGGGTALERVRHVKRGTEYEVLGEAEAQVSADSWGPNTFRQVRDGNELTFYRCIETGKLWCRFTDEFRDGRFETIAPAADPEAGADWIPDVAIQAALKVWHEIHDDANVDDEPEDLEHAAMEFALLEADKVRGVSAGASIRAGLEDALAFSRGDRSRATLLTMKYGELVEIDDDDPSTIAQELEDAAFHASPRRAATYRRLAAVLREPGFGEARS